MDAFWRPRPKKIKIGYPPTRDIFPFVKHKSATDEVGRSSEKELEGSVLASTKDIIDLEAHVGIKHVEVVLQLDSEIEELKVEDSRLYDSLALLKTRLKKIKDNFV